MFGSAVIFIFSNCSELVIRVGWVEGRGELIWVYKYFLAEFGIEVK